MSDNLADTSVPPNETTRGTSSTNGMPDADSEHLSLGYAELAGIVLGAQSVTGVVHRIAEIARVLIAGADEVSITLIENGRPHTVGFAGPLASVLDERQYSAGRGPCLDAAVTGQTIAIEDTATDRMYPDWARQAHRHGIQHTLSVGMPALRSITGAVNVYSRGEDGPFPDHARDTAAEFAGYAVIALANAALVAGAQQEIAQMKEAMASRSVIEQAKGIIMRDRACGPDEAFDVLRTTSSLTNRKLRDIAQVLVQDAANGNAVAEL